MAKIKKSINIKGLMRVGHEEHILELQNQGKLFCNSIKYFRELEKTDKNRHDDREGAFKTEILDPEKLSLSKDGKKLPVTFTFFRLNKFDNSIDQHKLYCMFGFKEKHMTGKPFVDERNITFGDKALIVFDTKEFVTRIKRELNSKNLKYSFDYVSYYEEKDINKNLSIFNKPKRFSYQNEFRFYIQHEDPSPLVIEIGSIEDISVIIDVEDLIKLNLKPLQNS